MERASYTAWNQEKIMLIIAGRTGKRKSKENFEHPLDRGRAA